MFFHFLKILIFGLLGGSKGKKWPKITKNYICHIPYLMKHTSYDCVNKCQAEIPRCAPASSHVCGFFRVCNFEDKRELFYLSYFSVGICYVLYFCIDFLFQWEMFRYPELDCWQTMLKRLYKKELEQIVLSFEEYRLQLQDEFEARIKANYQGGGIIKKSEV